MFLRFPTCRKTAIKPRFRVVIYDSDDVVVGQILKEKHTEAIKSLPPLTLCVAVYITY
jgi:hypothetical protein